MQAAASTPQRHTAPDGGQQPHTVPLPPSAAAPHLPTAVTTAATATATTPTSKKPPKAHPLVHIISGAASGSVAAFVTTPLDVIKTRIQASTHHRNRGLKGTLQRIIAHEGFGKLYSGLSPTLMGLLPNWAIYFATYELLKTPVSETIGKPENSPFVHTLCAMMAGTACSLSTNPLWVVKTRLMTQSATSHHQYSGTIDAFRSIWRNEGVRGFYKGITPSIIGVVHVGIQFPLYERLKNFFQERHPDRPLGTLSLMASAAVSKVVASVAWYPHEVVRTRLQNQSSEPPKYRGVVHTIRTILAEEGVRGLYGGLATNLIRVVPAGVITFTSYEMFCRFFGKLAHEQE